LSLPEPPEPEHDPPPGGLSSRAALTIFLAIALLATLVVTGILGVRLRDQKDRSSLLEQQVSLLNDEVEQLRGDLRGSESGDPLKMIATAVSRLRGLRFKHGVQPEVLSPAGLADKVAAQFKRDNTRADLSGISAVLSTYGLVPRNYDLYDDLLGMQQEEVAGFYDPRSGRMVVGASDAKDPTPFGRVILAHEYTHALADQHFGLQRLDRLNEENADDAATAYLALAEGDATYTMNLYQTEILTSEQQAQFLKQATAITTPRFDAAPQYLRDVLQFPYFQGLDFVQTLHDRGGFALIDQAYKDPPASTEQILHPNRYLDSRDEPTPVRLPDVQRALGPGWHSIASGGMGEYDVLELLDRGGGQGLDYAEARAGAAGWDGGEYEGFRSSAGVVVATLTVWDSESEAREAQDAFDRWLPVRYPGGNGFTDRGDGWMSPSGAGEVARDGARVLLMLGPNQRDVERAASAFSGF
jgi:hypothetical protein